MLFVQVTAVVNVAEVRITWSGHVRCANRVRPKRHQKIPNVSTIKDVLRKKEVYRKH